MNSPFVIQLAVQNQDTPCALCHRPVGAHIGPQLVVSESEAPLCLECGRRHAPILAALVGLSRVADRVGGIARRNHYWVPLKSQLDVLRAAECFFDALENKRSQLTGPRGACA